jgi:hypothetical protein
MEHRDSVISVLKRAAAEGVTATELRKFPNSTTEIKRLKAEGSVRGPLRIGHSNRYFASEHAPTRDQLARLIEERLCDAGLRLTSLSKLESFAKLAPKTLFKDALSALKADGRIIELRDSRKSRFYLHSEPLLEQLRPELQPPEPPPNPAPPPPGVTLDQVRPIYENLKAQQGGISTVTISDVLSRIGVTKEALHRLLLDEAKNGLVTLHPATTVNFPQEVLDAGIRLEGQPYPLVTFVLRERA